MNKNGRSLTLRAVNFLALTLCLLTTLRAFAALETAQPADALVDSIGVNIHLHYYDTAYNNYSTIIKPRLQELGIRHVRDGVIIGNTDKITKLQDLYNSLGIKSILIADPRSSTAVQARDYIKTVGVNTVAYAEGPNEPDISGNANWGNDTRAYQQALWNAIKGDPATANLPVVATSLTSEGAATSLGSLVNYLDYGCIHNYYGGRNPETGGWGGNGYGSLTWSLTYVAQPVSGAEPVVSTETGWHNSLTTGSGHKGTPESVVGKYMPRLFLFHFNRGIARSYPYEFIDEWANQPSNLEANFGLLRYDGSPKPSFTALKNLIALLKDPGATFSPGSLDYSLSGSTANIHKTLLQKRDGTFYLALWVGTQIWNPDTQVETSATPQAITISVPAGITNAATVVPNDGTNWSATPISGGNINLSVADKVVLVRLGGTGGGGTPVPDLIVTDVGWTPATPVAGNAVRFSATVKNQGTAATAAGVIMGVSFQVNGSQVSWSDTNSSSLAPGASIVLTANGSPAGGNGTWTATAGSHTVEAWVDDLNRIAESDESNNKLSETLTVGSGTLPNPPSSLLAAASGKRKINLTWTQSTSSGITQNKVYRSTTGSAGPYTLRATLGAVASYLDTGLTSGQSYFYVVTAVDGNGESGYSNYSGTTAR